MLLLLYMVRNIDVWLGDGENKKWQLKGTKDRKLKTKWQWKVVDRDVEKVVVFITRAYFFHVEACQGRQQQEAQMSDRKVALSVYH